jgi:hypothetical protein
VGENIVQTEIEVAESNYPKAELGRQVRFVLGHNQPGVGKIRTATIVLVHDDGKVNLNVCIGEISDLHPAQKAGRDTNLFAAPVEFDPEKKPGTWHWPDHAAKTAPAKDVPSKN